MEALSGALSHNKQLTSLRLAINDIYGGTFGTDVWFHLAWHDIKQRYARSMIGPFWMTISMAALLCAMGPLYARLFKQEAGAYFQYISVSFVLWGFISSQISESCAAFISADGFIKQVKLPLTVHLHRVLARNIIIFAHNLLVVVVVLSFYPPERFLPVLLAPVGLALVLINLMWIGIVLSTLSARFRDIPQMVTSVMLLFFFLTPIVWKRGLLAGSTLVADANPLYHFVEIIRAPLLGHYPTYLSWTFLGVMGLLGWVFALAIFRRYRSRVAYWV